MSAPDTTSQTTVASIKRVAHLLGLIGGGAAAGILRSRNVVYIGRGGYYGPRYGRLPHSKWHNPHLTLAAYEQHIRSSPDLLAALPELRGKVLLCWCRPDTGFQDGQEICHGQVLARLCEERDG